MIGQKIAITSKKPQTTRNRIQTVYTDERGQIIFLDTPGIHPVSYTHLDVYKRQVLFWTPKDIWLSRCWNTPFWEPPAPL